MRIPKLVVSLIVCLVGLILFLTTDTAAQVAGKSAYSQISSFSLVKGARVTAHTFKSDRTTITLSGTIYFSEAINGKHTGAVFQGTGKFSAPVPESSFEKANVRRLLKADIVESDFDTAVIRMSDGSLDAVASQALPMTIPPDAQKLATEYDERILKDTGANLGARLAVSLLNNEGAGVFAATFRGGKIGTARSEKLGPLGKDEHKVTRFSKGSLPASCLCNRHTQPSARYRSRVLSIPARVRRGRCS